MPYTATRHPLTTNPTFSGTPSRATAKAADFRAGFWNDGHAVGEERAILFVFGLLVSALSVFMILPAIVDFVDGNPEGSVFAWTTAISLFFGIALALGNAHSDIRLDQRHAFLLTAASWIGLSIVGALPFVLADTGMSFTDAFFETVSGLTTTGSTVMSDLDQLPRGILLWRALLAMGRRNRHHRHGRGYPALPQRWRHAVVPDRIVGPLGQNHAPRPAPSRPRSSSSTSV